MKIPEIVLEDLSNLNLAPYNPRKMDEKEMNKLIDSINAFGFVDPVIVNKNKTVVGGHQRIAAWHRMGNKQVPCIYVDLTKDKEKALNIALNKISGDWDNNKLNILLKEINASDINIGITGFDDKELKNLIGEAGDLEIITGENDEDEDLEINYIPQANVKMLQLYFNSSDYDDVTRKS